MPSPFPGMDPYLEGAEWGSFHIELSSAITRELISRLPPKYYARTMPHFITATPSSVFTKRNIYPDVAVTMREPGNTWAVPTAVYDTLQYTRILNYIEFPDIPSTEAENSIVCDILNRAGIQISLGVS